MSVDTAGLSAAVREYAVTRAENLSQEYVDTLRSLMPRRTGEMADSVRISDFDVGEETIAVTVIVDSDYAAYQNDGTGIFGPNGTPIYPTSAKVLRFDWAAAGGIVFAAHVAGTEPQHFMERTAEQWPGIVRSA